MSWMPRTASRRRWLASLTVVLAVILLAVPTTMAWAAGPQRHAPRRHVEAELLGLALLNCTRTGGWVRADGSCDSYDSGIYSKRLPALTLHKGISRKVAFRWAKMMVNAKVCGHVIPGKPGLSTRFSAAGFKSRLYGENVGCGWGRSKAAAMVIATHRSMQGEKGSGGWHWRNMKNARFVSVGIGVATMGGMTTIVYDFYGR